jgi:hypothetical protein
MHTFADPTLDDTHERKVEPWQPGRRTVRWVAVQRWPKSPGHVTTADSVRLRARASAFNIHTKNQQIKMLCCSKQMSVVGHGSSCGQRPSVCMLCTSSGVTDCSVGLIAEHLPNLRKGQTRHDIPLTMASGCDQGLLNNAQI